MSTTMYQRTSAAPTPQAPQNARRSVARRVVLGKPDAPAWHRLGFIALLIITAVLYLWGLDKSGDGNEFYAAAVQAGTQSWKAFFFGSSDASNFITVDKPPASLWVMELSGRIFGFNSWSMLAPQALEGVAAVALVAMTVKRWFGAAAGLIGGALFATVPAAVLMFRFNNPDALLVLLLVASAYCVTRALEKASGRWLALAGLAIGFAFLTKMMQAFLVVPGFALVYMIAAPTTLWRRIKHLLVSGAVMVASLGWWVAIVELWPASSRPYIGGSTDNSILNLIFGYNGLGRVLGNTGGSSGGGGGGGQGGNFSGTTGALRLFNSLMGAQASWLLPAAVIGLLAGIALRGRAPRTDRTRAALLLWGSWLFVTAAVFSYGKGTIHTYYTVALAPAIGALLVISGRQLWDARHLVFARITGAAMIATTGIWSYQLIGRENWNLGLRTVVALGTIVAVLAIAFAPYATKVWRKVLLPALATGMVLSLSGTVAYAAVTSSTAHTGSVPAAGPSGSGMGGGRMGGGMGGGGTSTSAALVRLLQADASKYRWVAAVSSSQSQAGLQLTSGDPVMSMGGFTGSDNAITLAQFEKYVANGDIHYYVASGGQGAGVASGGQGAGGGMGGGPGGGGSATSSITTWVEAHYKAVTVDSQTIYDLTSPTS